MHQSESVENESHTDLHFADISLTQIIVKCIGNCEDRQHFKKVGVSLGGELLLKETEQKVTVTWHRRCGLGLQLLYR